MDEIAKRVDLEGRLKRLVADHAAEFTAHEQRIRTADARVRTARLDLQTAPVRSAIDVQKFAFNLEEALATHKALIEETAYLEAKQTAERRALLLTLEKAVVEEGRARRNLERLTVRAPVAGLVVSQQIYRGGDFHEIRTGDQVRPGQPYLQIVDVGSMVVEAVGNQADVAKLRIGAPAILRLDAYPGMRLNGRVRSIGAVARPSGWRRSHVAIIPVTLDIEETDSRLIPSLSASADILLADEESLRSPVSQASRRPGAPGE